MDKSKGMMMIIIVMLAVVIIAIVGGVIFLMMNMDAIGGDGYGGQQIIIIPEITAADIRPIELGEPITTNLLASPDGQRNVVSVEIGIGINNTDPAAADDIIESIMEREIVVRHIATEIFRATTREELDHAYGQAMVAEDITQALSAEFGTHLIVRAYLGNLITGASR